MESFKLFFEGKGFPLLKLRDVEDDQTKILVCCDFLQEMGFDNKPLDKNNFAYIKPIGNRINDIFKKRFPHFEIVRRGKGHIPTTYYYTIFNRDLLENAFKFLHISQTHIIDIKLDYHDFCRNFDPNEIKIIAQKVFAEKPELFSGTLTGINHIPRASIDYNLWGYYNTYAFRTLPHETMRAYDVYARAGLIAVLDEIAAKMLAKWGIYLDGKHLCYFT